MHSSSKQRIDLCYCFVVSLRQLNLLHVISVDEEISF